MKKLITALLMISMLLSLAACGSSSEPKETESTSAGTEGKKVLRVGMECAYAPYNWAQPDDSNGAVPIADSDNFAYGYDVMMAKYIADQMDYELEIYQIDWDSLPLAVQSGTIDCVIAGQSITAERLQSVDFSSPYYYASLVALTTNDSPYASAKGISELAGATCTSQINTVWYDVCLPQIKDAKILPAMESAPAMLTALDSGKVNLVVTDMPTALAATQVYDNFVLLDYNETNDNFQVSEEEINIGVSLKKGNSELLEAINAALATLTEEDFNTMMEEAISVQPISE